MNGERGERIERLFHECLERSEDERARYLAEACEGDEELRREVESLLAADGEGDATLGAAVAQAAGEVLRRTPAPAGYSVGPYRIERELGSGGMGVVYLGRRADEEFDKQVAIKLIHRGLDSALIAQRFRTERQILASLEHPNIARLLDGGTTGDGRPFLVMEYVEGVPLVEYADRERLTLRRRLELFQQVCRAVEYAHRNLVVHRDLKPDNILVDGGGTPKLLDFGVAKLLGESLGDVTLTQMRPLTPGYASPEQVAGGTITTASDVYSLGAILFELLSGIRAQAVAGKTYEEMLRTICVVDPERPSVCVARRADKRAAEARWTSVARLERELRGDLDAIVMKALRKEPELRYGSVEQLSQDVDRYLQQLPVLARRHTVRYRLTRFVRRNRVAVVSAVTLSLALAGFSVVTQVQARRIERERDKANRVVSFLVELFTAAAPSVAQGRTITAREIVDRAAERIPRELGNDPEMRATISETIGGVYQTLGLLDRALEHEDAAVKIREQVLGQSPLELARPRLALARICYQRGDRARAERLFQQILSQRAELRRRDPVFLSDVLNNLGTAYQQSGRVALAEPVQREALALLRSSGAAPADEAVVLNNLGLTLLEQKKPGEAETLFAESLAINRKLGNGVSSGVASCLNNLAMLHNRRGDTEGAIGYYREALQVRTKLHGEEHPQSAVVMLNLANALADKGSYGEAGPLARRALAVDEKLLPADHVYIGHAKSVLGRILLESGDAAAAEPVLRASLAVFSKRLPAGNPLRSGAEALLGRCLVERQRYAEAEPLLLGSWKVLTSERGTGNQRVLRTAQALARLYAATGRSSEADHWSRASHP